MLVQLAQKPKAIAWTFFTLFYVELLLTPVMASAAAPYPMMYRNAGIATWRPLKQHLLSRPTENLSATRFNQSLPVADHAKPDADAKISPAPLQAPEIGGPGQPEMQSFSSVNAANMVDLFTGNFSYNIPLIDVGGYPVSLGYTAGATMDQEASWVGLGWNINPGTISRNLRGLPDDFNGDIVKKTVNMKPNKTVGVTAGADVELAGFPKGLEDKLRTEDSADYSAGVKIGTSLGVTHNNYKGWGIEHGLNASLNAGKFAKGMLSAGLSLTNSTTEGVSINPSVTLSGGMKLKEEGRGGGGLTLSLPYNSRSGLQALQLSMGTSFNRKQTATHRERQTSGGFQSSLISFYQPSVIPTINVPYTSNQFTFTGKVGSLTKVFHPSGYVTGYVSKQFIDASDTTRVIPAYGYLNYQNGAGDAGVLLDYNREKELPYREKPVYPHVAVPAYTYDAFSISGEGTGGMFRAYRGEIGFVHDHFMKSKSFSGKGGIDIGIGDKVHWGADVGVTTSDTRTGPWSNSNPVAEVIKFRKDSCLFEGSYFRNPGEKAINSKKYYEALGGDDVVAVHLDQYGSNSSTTQAIAVLDRYNGKKFLGSTPLNNSNAIKTTRDKRTQVISYLTAAEADAAGLNKYIENYIPNYFDASICGETPAPSEQSGGVKVEVFNNTDLEGTPIFTKCCVPIWVDETGLNPFHEVSQYDYFSIRWTGRIRAPQTGKYTFSMEGDDGFRLKINGQLILQDWRRRDRDIPFSGTVNLEKDQFYEIVVELYDNEGECELLFHWGLPDPNNPGVSGTLGVLPNNVLYPPAIDSLIIKSPASPAQTVMVKENRVNSFRKKHHISEITVLNADGRRYIYGIPVYNLLQKDLTFSVEGGNQSNIESGQIAYQQDDNTSKNKRGRDEYFTKEEIPAYAHSYLLTGIVSDDYADLTGDGITEDDPGNAVKFNYSKLSGVHNPFKWKAPFLGENTASYNEGLRTDYRDDKASYAYGEKEMWYLHSIESKTMIATFVTASRNDMPSIDENGKKDYTAPSRRLEKIYLYNKSDFAKNGSNAIPVKTVHFEYSYELCKGMKDAETGKLTLKKVWFSYNGIEQPVAKSNPYIFSYHSNNPSYNSQYSDRWASYKSPLQNPGSTVLNPIRNSEYPYAIQDSAVAAANAGAWNLDSIYLPSGGSMKIDYESDDYGFIQNQVATQMFKLAGLGLSSDFAFASPTLYSSFINKKPDHLYVFIKVPVAVTSAADVYNLYLAGLTKLYFKTLVKVPTDNYSNGQTHEYVPCYARFNPSSGNYGFSAPDVIWVKMETVDADGKAGGDYSPIAKAATQFLRLNLPSKAYPGSETGDDLDLAEAVQMLATLAKPIVLALQSFDKTARNNNWVNEIDLNKSFVRLLNPNRKKYGGGHRVKRITVYDNWDKMTNQRPAKYGQEYIYTTEEEVNGKKTMISSGVAEYEPAIGGDENPFHLPIEYVDQPSVIAPMTMGYSEEPLGEAFYPSPGVGYSKVRVRSIHHLNKKSANGFDETSFYTARDFPIYADRTLFDDATKKRYRPAISNFFRINSYHFLSLTQGFKVELNDMHGKLRSKASYPENNPKDYITYEEYFYRTENTIYGKRLSNTVMAIHPDGKIDSAALIGKDVELMVDMREQESLTISTNIPINVDAFTLEAPPFIFALPSLINAYQREKNLYRSVAAVKLIHRYGILDSVLAVNKGSRISTKDVLYDSETGDVLLTRTQNEFNDYVYNFNYPSHWAYPSMGHAYRNIDVYLEGMTLRDGKLLTSTPAIDSMLTSGDEILVTGKQKTSGSTCDEDIATFGNFNKIWCIDSSEINGGQRSLYFIDRYGKPYTAFDVTMKVVRSGRRNIFTSVGSISSLEELLKKDGSGNYQLVVDDNSKVLAAGANEFSQFWKVDDMKRMKRDTTDVYSCPEGYTYSPSRGTCIKDTTITITQNFSICAANPDSNYTACGSYLYSFFNTNNTSFIRSRLPINSFWANDHYRNKYCSTDPVLSQFTAPPINLMSESEMLDSLMNKNRAHRSAFASTIPLNGPLNRSGIWLCLDDSGPRTGQWRGITVPVYIPEDSTYYIGMGADNQIRVTIDGDVFRQDFSNSEPHNFQLWHIFPKYLSRGIHIFKIENYDVVAPGSFGLEIYHNTEAELRGATDYSHLNLIFSTKDIRSQSLPETYSCPLDYKLDKNDTGAFVCRKYLPVTITPVYSSECRSIVIDTAFNPFITGTLGTWRTKKAYTFYESRAESDPTVATNIRKDGAYKNFIPYWSFNASNLTATSDTVKWVWNSEVTLFNKKGMELENKDPLGRFNAGIYGYDQTLPVAVVQNSRYREATFEGFEDYHAATTNCTLECIPARHFDFGAYINKMDTSEAHTGKRSLKLIPGDQAGITVELNQFLRDTVTPRINFLTQNGDCSGTVLDKVITDDKILLPSFSPTPGKKLLVSVWVKELQDCKCTSYENNQVIVVLRGPGETETSVVMKPTGSIIEGWQRYEFPVEVSDQVTHLTVNMQASGNATVFFDDLRIHPFNANMKSFIYHPVNLRLMAELDENNYASFYEYDDEGTLIRLKKETQRGIKTIKETRSSQAK